MATICIAGKNEIAVKGLQYLIDHYRNDFDLCVITNKTDDGQTSWQPSLKRQARMAGIKEVLLEDIYKVEELIFLSLEFDRIIKPDLFASKALFNIHFSALPKYKGMYTSIMPLLAGEKESGVTLHMIEKGIDTGDIIDQLLFPLEWSDTGRDLYQKYLDHAFLLLKKNIDSLIDSTWEAHPQDKFGGSYFSKKTIDFANITIDFRKTAFEIHNQIRAFTFRDYQLPAFNDWAVYKSEITEEKSYEKPGAVLLENEAFFEIATIDYTLRLFKDYYSSFWKACESGQLESIRTVLQYIPDINLRNKKGWNGLIIATYNNHPELVRFLLDKGGDLHSCNYKGTTLPMYALSAYKNTGDDSMLRLILAAQPDLLAEDENGRDLMNYAQEYGDTKIIELIKSYSG